MVRKDYVTDTRALEIPQAEKAERLVARSVKVPSGCWEWAKSINTHGYGSFWLGGRHLLAHRAAYDIFIGPIPPGMFVCHTCDNRKCINPEHLFLGSVLTNNQDTSKKGRCRCSAQHYRFCKHGHEYTPENTYVAKTGRQQRRCRICLNERQRLFRRRKREMSSPKQHSEPPHE